MTHDRLQTAVELARQAGGLLREGYRQPKQVDLKGTIDLVTEYDLSSEKLLVSGIQTAFPDDAIVAEEGSRAAGDSYLWYVDPLDGTTNYSHGLPFYSVTLAVSRDDELLFGVVYDPERDELFQAAAGEGALLNGEPIGVSAASSLADSLLVTGFPYDIRTNPDNNLDHYEVLALRSRGVRRLGSAALDLAYVACGRLDGYWELRLNLWDWAAGVLMVREAGGQVTTMAGDEKVLAGDETLLATNGIIHEQMIEALRQR